jgi:hypothetical protein
MFSGFYKVRRFLLTALVVGGALAMLAGCSSSDDPIAVGGVWTINDGEAWSERWTITNSTIHYESGGEDGVYTTTYRATIVDYVNGRLNTGDTALAAGREITTNPGFAMIKYTEVDGPGTGEVGKFNVFRWADNNEDNTLRDFTQGYKNIGDDWPNNVNGVFDTAAEAEEGATNAEGYFAFPSEGAGR